jgi:hypothetical protein
VAQFPEEHKIENEINIMESKEQLGKMNSIAQNKVTQLYLQHCSKREMQIHACDKYAHE